MSESLCNGDDQAILRYTGTGRRGTEDDFAALIG